MEELIRSRIRDALDVEPAPANLRWSVISAVPMTRPPRWRMPNLSFQWIGGLLAALLAVAIVAGLMYSRGLIGQQVNSGPKPTPAHFNSPEGIVVSPDGSVYFADFVSGDVFRIGPYRSLIPVAGTGTDRSNGPAIREELHHPAGLAFDSQGNLYIAEYAGLPNYSQYVGTVRRVDRSGNMTTVAGGGDSTHPTNDGVPATSARLNTPLGLAFDSAGNMYIADEWDGRVRIVDPRGIIRTLDVSKLARGDYFAPGYLAFDSSGNLYVSDRYTCRIVRFSTDGTPSVIAGSGICGFGGDGGPATAAQLDDPNGIAFDSLGNLYFADANNHRIRRIDQHGVITTVVGTGDEGSAGDGGTATKAQLLYPYGIAMAPGDILYVSDAACACVTSAAHGRIRMVNLRSGVISSLVTPQTPIAGG